LSVVNADLKSDLTMMRAGFPGLRESSPSFVVTKRQVLSFNVC
jgi:hypothetical protein